MSALKNTGGTQRGSQRQQTDRIEVMPLQIKSVDDTGFVYDTLGSGQNSPIKGGSAVGYIQSGSTSMPRRHLPIEQKKKVFNEWGAVLRHQDEVEQRVRQDQLT